MEIKVKNVSLAAIKRGLEQAKASHGVPDKVVVTPTEAYVILKEVRATSRLVGDERCYVTNQVTFDGDTKLDGGTDAIQTYLAFGSDDVLREILNVWYRGDLKVFTHVEHVPIVIERQYKNQGFPEIDPDWDK